MSNTDTAVGIAATFTAIALQALLAEKEYTEMVRRSRSEGRDISDAELDGLRARGQALTDRLAEKLG